MRYLASHCNTNHNNNNNRNPLIQAGSINQLLIDSDDCWPQINIFNNIQVTKKSYWGSKEAKF